MLEVQSGPAGQAGPKPETRQAVQTSAILRMVCFLYILPKENRTLALDGTNETYHDRPRGSTGHKADH